mgnify:CR=1
FQNTCTNSILKHWEATSSALVTRELRDPKPFPLDEFNIWQFSRKLTALAGTALLPTKAKIHKELGSVHLWYMELLFSRRTM